VVEISPEWGVISTTPFVLKKKALEVSKAMFLLCQPLEQQTTALSIKKNKYLKNYWQIFFILLETFRSGRN
jgi:hypothetical protein